MQLYDMHSHILPGIDDGAPSVEKSLVILNELKKQGVTNVCLTPHFYTNEISAEDFAAQRQHAIDNLMPHIPDGMKVVVGAEVYVTRCLTEMTFPALVTATPITYLPSLLTHRSFQVTLWSIL